MISSGTNVFPDKASKEGGPKVRRSLGWLVLFALIYFIAPALYGLFFGMTPAVRNTLAPDGSIDSAAIQAKLIAEMSTPFAIAIVAIIQFICVPPVVLLASNFKNKRWKETLHFFPLTRRHLVTWLAIFLAYIFLEVLGFFIFQAKPGTIVPLLQSKGGAILIVVVTLLAPFTEELVFRGYLFAAFRSTKLGLIGTLLLTSALFVLIHVGQGDFFNMAMLSVFSVMVGVSREKTGTLWTPIILHGANNILAVAAALI